MKPSNQPSLCGAWLAAMGDYRGIERRLKTARRRQRQATPSFMMGSLHVPNRLVKRKGHEPHAEPMVIVSMMSAGA